MQTQSKVSSIHCFNFASQRKIRKLYEKNPPDFSLFQTLVLKSVITRKLCFPQNKLLTLIAALLSIYYKYICIYIYTYVQNRHFWKFSNNSFRNELHAPFYSILIPNTSCIKFFILFVVGSQGVPAP